MMRPYETDYRLWGVLASVCILGIALAEYRYDPESGLIASDVVWVQRGFDHLDQNAPDVAAHIAVMLAMAVAAGWSFHALLVLCGIRMPAVRLTRLPAEAVDYDDAQTGQTHQ